MAFRDREKTGVDFLQGYFNEIKGWLYSILPKNEKAELTRSEIEKSVYEIFCLVKKGTDYLTKLNHDRFCLVRRNTTNDSLEFIIGPVNAIFIKKSDDLRRLEAIVQFFFDGNGNICNAANAHMENFHDDNAVDTVYEYFTHGSFVTDAFYSESDQVITTINPQRTIIRAIGENTRDQNLRSIYQLIEDVANTMIKNKQRATRQ